MLSEIKCRKCFSRNVSVEYTDVFSKHKFRCIVKFSLWHDTLIGWGSCYILYSVHILE